MGTLVASLLSWVLYVLVPGGDSLGQAGLQPGAAAKAAWGPHATTPMPFISSLVPGWNQQPKASGGLGQTRGSGPCLVDREAGIWPIPCSEKWVHSGLQGPSCSNRLQSAPSLCLEKQGIGGASRVLLA